MKRFVLFLVFVFSLVFISYAEPTNLDLHNQLIALEWKLNEIQNGQSFLLNEIYNSHSEVITIINNLTTGGTECDLSEVENLLNSILTTHSNFINAFTPKINDMHTDLASVKDMLYEQAMWNEEFRSAFDDVMSSLRGDLNQLGIILHNLYIELEDLSDSMEEGFGDVLGALETINDNLEDLPVILTTLREMKIAQTDYFSAFDTFASDFSLKMDVFEAIFLNLEVLLEQINESVLFAGERLFDILMEILEFQEDLSIEETLQALISIQSETTEFLTGLSSTLSSLQAAIEGLTTALQDDLDFPDYSERLISIDMRLEVIKNSVVATYNHVRSIDLALSTFFSDYNNNQTALTTHQETLIIELKQIVDEAEEIKDKTVSIYDDIKEFKDAFTDFVEVDEEHKEKVDELIDSDERVSPGELDADVYDSYEEEIEDEIDEDAQDFTPEFADITGEIEDEIEGFVEELAGFEESVSELVMGTMDKVKFEVGTFSSSFRYSMDFPLDTGGTYEAVFEVDFCDEPYSSIGNSARAIGIFVWTVITCVYAYRSSRHHLLALISN